jgi:hypothetical protein
MEFHTSTRSASGFVQAAFSRTFALRYPICVLRAFAYLCADLFPIFRIRTAIYGHVVLSLPGAEILFRRTATVRHTKNPGAGRELVYSPSFSSSNISPCAGERFIQRVEP